AANPNLVSWSRTLLAQLVFYTKLRQAIRQIAHCLVVVEVCLHNPTLWLSACNSKPKVAIFVFFALNRKVASTSAAIVAPAS
ncbi:hypothetical protein QP295_24520, partial [Escherichia coli]|nr:hypothetical protein [Escherichia coli]